MGGLPPRGAPAGPCACTGARVCTRTYAGCSRPQRTPAGCRACILHWQLQWDSLKRSGKGPRALVWLGFCIGFPGLCGDFLAPGVAQGAPVGLAGEASRGFPCTGGRVCTRTCAGRSARRLQGLHWQDSTAQLQEQKITCVEAQKSEHVIATWCC
jgi:hypothetical protein